MIKYTLLPELVTVAKIVKMYLKMIFKSVNHTLKEKVQKLAYIEPYDILFSPNSDFAFKFFLNFHLLDKLNFCNQN